MRLQATFAAAALFALGAAGPVAGQGGPPLRPSFDAAGNFVHDPGVTVSVVALSPAGLTLECRRGPQVWRERYLVQDGKLALAAVGTQHLVPERPEHTEWQETTIAEAAPSAAAPAPSPAGAPSIGTTSMDAHWSNYGSYVSHFLAAIQGAWDRERIDRRLYPVSGTRVTVTFTLNAAGAIPHIVHLEMAPNTPEPAVRACVDAILAHAPYPAWTEDMQGVLGQEQQMTLAFYYP